MLKFWIINSDGLPISNGKIVAKTFEEADSIFFLRLCNKQCPLDATLIEELSCEEIQDSDIISVSELKNESKIK